MEVGDIERARREMGARFTNAAKDIEVILGEVGLDEKPRGREDM